MKKTVYDFKDAIKIADNWYKPSELSRTHKDKALRLASLKDEVDIVPNMQCAVLDVCEFLDAIVEKEVEQ